jgi:hypothetical protein
MKVNKIEMAEALVALLVPALQVIFSGECTAKELKNAEQIRSDVMNVAKFHEIVDLVKSEAMSQII